MGVQCTVKRTEKMQVAVLTEKGLELREAPIPECGPGQVLVRTVACGICSGEVYVYKSVIGGSLREAVMGHEGSGIVEAVGAGVDGFAEGDPVTSTGGRFAGYFISRPGSLVRLPAEVDPVWAMGEPLACVFHAARRFGIEFGDRVAILGCGFMGLMCLQAALLRGPGYVCAMDTVPWRLDVAKRFGADEVYNPEEQSGNELVERLGEFDVVIEAAGTSSAIDMSTDLVKQHGRIVLVGYHLSNDGMRTVNMERWNFKSIDVVNGHGRRGNEKRDAMRASVDLLRAGRLNTAELVTSYPLAKVGEAFQDLVNVKEGLFKVALIP